jgi:hypothetical protein
MLGVVVSIWQGILLWKTEPGTTEIAQWRQAPERKDESRT